MLGGHLRTLDLTMTHHEPDTTAPEEDEDLANEVDDGQSEISHSDSQRVMVIQPSDPMIKVIDKAVDQWSKVMQMNVEMHKGEIELKHRVVGVFALGVKFGAALAFVFLLGILLLVFEGKDVKLLMDSAKDLGVVLVSLLAGPQLMRLFGKDKAE